MAENGSIYIDTLTCSGSVEALTSRAIVCSSVFLLPASGDTVSLVDWTDDNETMVIPTNGITVPVNNPALIRVKGDCGCESLTWMAV